MRINDQVLAKATLNKTFIKTLISSALLLPFAGTVNAQTTLEEVVVTGSRQVIQDQIAIKRSAIQIVDGLSAEDIGDLPALSIGEALESITGAASHRENGGATEISIRGLGPFLSATTFNGREATNGSGDRSVNFSQFPSELMSKLAIYKTQDASLIEGGVAGLIALETLRPLDYNKRRFQIDAKANYNPDEDNINNSLQSNIGFRGTASYVDQYEFADGSAIGWSIGMQNSSTSQPEAEVRSSSPSGSSLFACINDPTVTTEGFFATAEDDDCEDSPAGSSNNGGYDTTIDPETGLAVDDGTPYAFTGSTRGYRQNETSEERDSYFAAFQFQPNEDWDYNLDFQYSDRIQAEERHDLNFEQKRSTVGVTGPSLVTTEDGRIIEWAGTVRAEANGEKFSRQEKYNGGGLNVSHNVNDRLTVDVDVSWSETTREELQISLRTQGSRIPVTWNLDSGIPQYTLEEFNVQDYSLFDEGLRARADRENVRENTNRAFRIDFDYELGGDLITSVAGGIRSSELKFLQYGGTGNGGNGTRITYEEVSANDLVGTSGLTVLETCAIPFPESGFLAAIKDGNLFTNTDGTTGEVIDAGTGSSWATFNNQCLADLLAGGEFAYGELEEVNTGTIDVTEDTEAAYVMANYETEFMDRSLRGNLGVRVVKTTLTSVGYRAPYDVVFLNETLGTLDLVELTDEIERIEGGASYTEVLPSFSYVWDYADDLIIRGGLFRGMSRADPSDLGFSRTFVVNDTDEATTLNDLISGLNGSGNPNTTPLTSWNADISFEWYPNDDSILAVGFYAKKFTGGFEQNTVLETFVVEGETLNLPITNSVTTDDTSTLTGVEITGSHRWDNGLGFKVSYNYADSDFVFEDSLYGDTFTTDLDGVTTQLTDGIVAPGNLPGFSQHVFSGQLYYQIGEFDVAAIYKYRSEYFQPYTTDGTRLRYVGDVGVWEARASYQLTDNIKLKLEAINLFDEPKSQYFFTDSNLGEVNDYGPRIFAGISAKF